MSEVMIKAVLDHIPDYQVDRDGVFQFRGNPSMTGLGKLPVTFTPGVKRGSVQAPCRQAALASIFRAGGVRRFGTAKVVERLLFWA